MMISSDSLTTLSITSLVINNDFYGILVSAIYIFVVLAISIALQPVFQTYLLPPILTSAQCVLPRNFTRLHAVKKTLAELINATKASVLTLASLFKPLLPIRTAFATFKDSMVRPATSLLQITTVALYMVRLFDPRSLLLTFFAAGLLVLTLVIVKTSMYVLTWVVSLVAVKKLSIFSRNMATQSNRQPLTHRIRMVLANDLIVLSAMLYDQCWPVPDLRPSSGLMPFNITFASTT
jgi:hypothetical protein